MVCETESIEEDSKEDNEEVIGAETAIYIRIYGGARRVPTGNKRAKSATEPTI